MSFSWMHTNDLHGKLTVDLAKRLEVLRAETDLFFDTGDAIVAGNLGIPLKPEKVWAQFAELRCTASVPGNRESHPLAAAFRAKLEGVAHPLLCGNLRMKDGSFPLPRTLELEVNGLKIGIAAAMIEMVTSRMKTQAASAYLWDPAIPTLLELAEDLRPRCDVLVALTHIGYRRDVELAQTGSFDIILGGHSHTILEQPEQVGKTWVCQGGSHARFVGVYRWEDGRVEGGLRPIA